MKLGIKKKNASNGNRSRLKKKLPCITKVFRLHMKDFRWFLKGIFRKNCNGNLQFGIFFFCKSYDRHTQRHMKWCRRRAEKEIMFKCYNGLKENHCNIKFNTAENYIKTSNRKEVEGLPEAAANVKLSNRGRQINLCKSANSPMSADKPGKI